MEGQTEQSILQEVELLRHQLEKTVHKKGYTHIETIQLSQKLDKLLNQYRQIHQNYTCHTSCRKVDSH